MPNDHYFSPDPNSPYTPKLISSIIRNKIFEFYTAPGVFSANRVDTGTLILLKKITIPEKGRILDLGCGIGVIGVSIGVINSNLEVHFIDVNSRATELAEKNAQKYELKSYSIFTGDMNKILNENSICYDSILFNPPVRLGKKIYYQQILTATKFLKPNGYIQIVIKKKLGAESAYNYFYNNLNESSYSMRIVGKNSGYWIFEIKQMS